MLGGDSKAVEFRAGRKRDTPEYLNAVRSFYRHWKTDFGQQLRKGTTQ
ncbi:MAG: hypothetical protein LBE12_00035 [Planctomycetaceae bacterium]|nr:hypothetical protein [Planctomycetaceae bacterium]